jgi:hypothetical protein
MDDIRSDTRSGASGRTPSAPVSSRTVGLAVAGVILLLFGTPLRMLWVNAPGSWWIVYLLWFAAICVLAGVARRGH